MSGPLSIPMDNPSERVMGFDPQKRPIPKGTIITHYGCKFEVLEDTTAHGCPRVRIIEPGDTKFKPGDETFRTLYEHLEAAERREDGDGKQVEDDESALPK